MGLFQFWHDAILATRKSTADEKRQQRTSADTFRRIVDGFVGESFGQAVKINFSTKVRRLRLFLWVIEPNLQFLSGMSSNSGSVCHLAESQGTKKVLFQVKILQFTLL
jgi:hypothetical protein